MADRVQSANAVGLGQTIQAVLLLRQAWLAGRAKRILILAPKAVLKQWQIELREKFNLKLAELRRGQARPLPRQCFAATKTRFRRRYHSSGRGHLADRPILLCQPSLRDAA